jgi:hypothetical protein
VLWKTLFCSYSFSFSLVFFSINPQVCFKRRIKRREQVWVLLVRCYYIRNVQGRLVKGVR